MSIYKKFAAPPEGSSSKGPDPQPEARAAGVATDDPKRLRRGSPANTLVPPTQKWVEGLPGNVRPNALLRQYPRIANLIAAAWRDPKAFYAYMESLLTDKRGNRKGFPADVLNELVALQQHYEMRNRDDNSVWGDVGRRG